VAVSDAVSADPRQVLAERPMHWRQVCAVGVATAINALDGYDVLSISFASPGIAADWQLDNASMGLVLSMELVGMAIGAFLLGALTDKLGRRTVTLGCLGVMTLGMALAAFATDIVMLSLIRLATGFAIGGVLATTNAIAAEFSNRRRRNLSVAVMAGGYPVGAVLGGLVAAYLLDRTGDWRSVFLFGAAATAAMIPVVFVLVPETVAFLVARQPRNALARINATLSRFGHSQVSDLPAAASEQRQSVRALLSPGMARLTLTLTAVYFLHILTFYFFLKWIPKIMVDQGHAASSGAILLVCANIGGALGALGLSLLTQKVDVARLTMAAMVVGAVAVSVFGWADAPLRQMMVIAAVAGAFTNAGVAGLYAILADAFPDSLRASGTGFAIGIGRGGAALGPIVGGMLFSAGFSLSQVAPIMACASLGAALLLFLRPRAPRADTNG
jgi:benzoate transport